MALGAHSLQRIRCTVAALVLRDTPLDSFQQGFKVADQDGIVSLADARRDADESGTGNFRSDQWASLSHAADSANFVGN